MAYAVSASAISVGLGRRPSVLLPRVSPSEERFHQFVKSGHVDAVLAFLTTPSPPLPAFASGQRRSIHFDIDCRDESGHSALQMAVVNEDAAMVDLLLGRSPSIGVCYNALLHAVHSGNTALVDTLLGHIARVAGSDVAAGSAADTGLESMCADFTPDITPLILGEARKCVLKWISYTFPDTHRIFAKCITGNKNSKQEIKITRRN